MCPGHANVPVAGVERRHDQMVHRIELATGAQQGQDLIGGAGAFIETGGQQENGIGGKTGGLGWK